MRITDFRLTSIWTVALPDALGPTDLGRFGTCVRAGDYTKLFRQVLEQDNDPLLSAPWPSQPGKTLPEKNRFWTKYLLDKLNKAKPSDRYDVILASLAPLRRKTPLARLTMGRRSFVEGWYHPHGVALTATLWCEDKLNAVELKRAATGFLSRPLTVTWPDKTVQTMGLNGLAGACLDTLCQEAFGVARPGALGDAMRVLTVVSLEDEAADTPQSEKDMLAAALDCVGGKPGASSTPPADCDVYLAPRGRLVWRPDKCRSERRYTHTLACLHRNVVVSTCQTASLIAGQSAALTALNQAGNVLAPRVEPYLKRLAARIELIHTGSDQTYDQDCLRRQTAAAKTDMNKLRGVLGLGALA